MSESVCLFLFSESLSFSFFNFYFLFLLFLSSVLVIATNLLIDLLYSVLDPRIEMAR